jgi:hypothetical protein
MAHLIPLAFSNSSRAWTVQRQEVDNFFGRYFEGDFEKIQYSELGITPADCIANPELMSKYRPSVEIDEVAVDYYIRTGEAVPSAFTKVSIEAGARITPLVLKMQADDRPITENSICTLTVAQDLRLPTLVSLLKCAHLTLFHMLGYSYPLSLGGRFLGGDVLGKFFLENHDRQKPEILLQAALHFDQFKNLVPDFAEVRFRLIPKPLPVLT